MAPSKRKSLRSDAHSEKKVWFMSDLKDQQIESLIRGHLNSELDQHVGAASRRFADMIAQDRQQRALPLIENRPKSKPTSAPKFGSFWSIGLVGAALAATMTIVAVRHNSPASHSSPFKSKGGAVQANPNNEITPIAYPGEVQLDAKLEDQGFVRMSDGSMARKMTRYTTNKHMWTNPKTKKKYEYIEPKQETVYLGLKQY
jgi:hypothetical protein